MKIFEIINLLDKNHYSGIEYALDTPRNGELIINRNSAQKISGWIAVDEDEFENIISIKAINNKDEEQTYISEAARPDAESHMMQKNKKKSIVKGFEIPTQALDTTRIYLQTKKINIPLFRVSAHLYAIQDIWTDFITKNTLPPLSILETDKQELKGQLLEFTKYYPFIKHDNIESFLIQSNYSAAQKTLFRRFISRFTSDDFVEEAVASSIEHGKIIIHMPHLDKPSRCAGSFHVSGTNILKFIYDGGAFFLIQHVSSCDAIYMVNEGLLIRFGHATPEHAVSCIIKYFENAIINGTPNAHCFSGIIASHGRPYHFHYDVALAVRKIFEQGLLPHVPRYIQLPGADFCGVDQLYKTGNHEKDIIADSNRINQITRNESGYFFHTGYLYNHERHKKLRLGYDAKIKHLAMTCDFGEKEREFNKLAGKRIVWFGVTGQKRAWIEQVDACVALLNKLSENVDNLAVIFDGWTSPMHPTQADERESLADMNVVNQIKSKLNKDIETFSIVGENSLVKIRLAAMAHFFVANQATGSIYIARIANKPGVTHISNAFYDATLKQHVLNQAIPIPRSLIKDIPDPSNPRMDFVSYSISVEDFLQFTLPLAMKQIVNVA